MPIFDNWTDETPLKEAVGQAIGAASGCWGNLDGAGVYDSERAIVIVDELTGFIVDCIDRAFLTRYETMDDRDCAVETHNPREPYLGCATTEELFREIIARFAIVADGRYIGLQTKVDHALILAEMLGTLTTPEREYRTVDSY